MEGNKIDPGHSKVRNILCIIGPIVLLTGLIFIVIGFIGFLSVFRSMGPPKHIWCFFVGLPLLFVGSVLSMLGFMGKIARYHAAEIAPVGKDTFNYLADGTQEGIKTVSQAIGTGLGAGLGTGFSAAGSEGRQVKIKCHKCNNLLEENASFCSKCGSAIDKSRPCPQCAELNDPDAKFCDNCSYKFS